MSRIPRNRVPRIDRVPAGPQLDAPGVTVTPPVPPEANLTGDLMRALGLTDQLAQAAARVAEQNRAADEKAGAMARGQAATRVAESVPQWEQLVLEDKLAVPDGYEGGVEGFARDFVEERLPPGVPETYKDEFRLRATHRVIGMLTDRQNKKRDEARKDAIAVTLNGVAGVVDQARLGATAKELEQWGLSPLEARAAVAGRLMAYAAQTGGEEHLAAARAFAGEDFKVEMTEAEARYRAKRAGDRAVVHQEFDDDIAEQINAGEPWEAVRARVRSWEGEVGAEKLHSKLQQIDSLERQQLGEGLRAHKRAIVDQTLRDAVAAYTPILADGDTTGGAAAVQDIHVTFPDGTEEKVAASQIVEAIRAAEWDQIDKLHKPGSDENLAQRINWLSKNPSVTDPQMEAAFNGARGRVRADTTDQTVPPTLVDAYRLFKTASAMNGQVAAAHMNERDHDFFRVAQFFEENLRDMSPGTALIEASRRLTREPTVADTISRHLDPDLLGKHTAEFGGAANGRAAVDIIAARARAYVMLQGGSDKSAILRAAEDFRQDFTLLNNVWVRTRGKSLGGVDLPAVAAGLAEFYVQENAPGESADNYTIAPDPLTGGWSVRFLDSPYPAPGSPVYTDADLQRLGAELRAQAAEAAVAETHRRRRLEQERREILDRPATTPPRGSIFGIEFVPPVQAPVVFRVPFTSEQLAHKMGPPFDGEVTVEMHGPPPADHLTPLLAFFRDPPKKSEPERQIVPLTPEQQEIVEAFEGGTRRGFQDPR